MKYLTIIVMSLTVLLFAACSSGGGEPTTEPEPEATETKPAMETAVPTEAPDPTDEPYPAEEPTTEPVDESYPGAAPTSEPYDPYPDQEAETTSEEIITDSAYPAEVDLSEVTSEPGDGQPQEAPKPGVPDDSTAISQQVNLALAERLGIDISEITVVIIEATEWSDSSLGCPASGYAYAQVITPGYKITLKSDGEEYNYHTDLNGNFVLCGEDGQPIE